jgi:hypothetical protein
VAGRLILEILEWVDAGNLSMQSRNGQLRVTDGNGTLTLHDNPTGLIRFNGSGEFVLTFPDGATFAAATPQDDDADDSEEGGEEGDGMNGSVLIATINGTQARIVFDNGTFNGTALTIQGFWALHVPVHGVAALFREEVRNDIQQAIDERRIGAEVRIQRAEASAVEILSYDDVAVEVDPLPEVVSEWQPLRIEVSSELEEGRTIVLTLDPGMLASADPDTLVISYFDVDGNGTSTEVEIRRATDLADVLDATDDAGMPEFWIVSDVNGVAVMVSVPEWSVHAITVQSIVEVLTQPSVIVGIVAGVGGFLLAAGVLVWPRRRHEEL